jgi:hypothetical protein
MEALRGDYSAIGAEHRQHIRTNITLIWGCDRLVQENVKKS